MSGQSRIITMSLRAERNNLLKGLPRRLQLFAMTLSILLITSISWGQTTVTGRIQQTEKSIVTVRTELTHAMHTTPGRMATFERTAVGLVINPSGIIVTNTHTIIHAPFIFVILRDGSKLPAELLFSSKIYDFSFLRIHPPYPLHSIPWADSSRIMVGDPVIAVRHLDHAQHSIIPGHVKNIMQNPSTLSHDFFELDLDLHQGDSGGPILDNQGRLLGVIMAIRKSAPHTSIAIASNKIYQQYLQYKKNMP